MANPRLGKKNKKDILTAAAVIAILILSVTLIINSSRSGTVVLRQPRGGVPPVSNLVGLTLSRIAKDRGALCLDGSVPGYHLERGFGPGSDSWLLHIEGGGWCNTMASCSFRKTTALGSSDHMERQVPFDGILSHDSAHNPDFFNWNRVKIRYCDGASFAGHPESEPNNGTKLFFRGHAIWEALMNELLSRGLSSAKQALLSGCSAGGLATLIHCDDFREMLPRDATVKCLSDAGFFLDEKDISGHHSFRSFYNDVVRLQGVANSLHKDCVARMEPFKCFFPREIVKNIKTPVFLVNPAYDFWQIRNVLVPDSADPHGIWLKCRQNIHNCDGSQLGILQAFCNSMLEALNEFQQNKVVGSFINSRFSHCQTWMAETWHSPKSPNIANMTIAESVGDWYFNDRAVLLIDNCGVIG